VLTTVLAVVLIVAFGTRLCDGLRLRQEESILHKLPVAEAYDYYELLKRRVRRVRVMRAVTLVSLVLALVAARRHFFPPPHAAATNADRPVVNTDSAKALAEAELRRLAIGDGLDPAGFELVGIAGDAKHPWIFEYQWTKSGSDRIRLYVSRNGSVEVHRVLR
jgi:hypothetical protein